MYIMDDRDFLTFCLPKTWVPLLANVGVKDLQPPSTVVCLFAADKIGLAYYTPVPLTGSLIQTLALYNLGIF